MDKREFGDRKREEIKNEAGPVLLGRGKFRFVRKIVWRLKILIETSDS